METRGKKRPKQVRNQQQTHTTRESHSVNATSNLRSRRYIFCSKYSSRCYRPVDEMTFGALVSFALKKKNRNPTTALTRSCCPGSVWTLFDVLARLFDRKIELQSASNNPMMFYEKTHSTHLGGKLFLLSFKLLALLLKLGSIFGYSSFLINNTKQHLLQQQKLAEKRPRQS